MQDLLPVSTVTIGIILLMISFLNQACLWLKFFQVQGRNRALEDNVEVRGLAICPACVVGCGVVFDID
ncbi:MAG: hypothetical protein V3W20_09900 [Candidatus Neomarinimicrobiota bacterium]